MYDSRDDEEDDDDVGEERPRAMIFANRNNLRLLGKSPTWFMDGTFFVSP